MENHTKHHNDEMHHYGKLLVMIVFSFVAIYILIYAMVDRFENAIPNINQIYMAGLMTMLMIIIELLVIGAMYKTKKANFGIMATNAIALVAFFFTIHSQVAFGGKQFLKSMIPQHASAVLMVKEAKLTDPQIKDLTNKIITSQQAGIEQMKAKIEELENAKS